MTKPRLEETNENQSRWEFIERATKDIENWTEFEKAEIHPERFVDVKDEGASVAEPTCNGSVQHV